MDTTTLLGEEIPLISSLRPVKERDLEEFKSSMEVLMSMSPEERCKVRIENYTKERDDLMTPSKLTAAYICSNAGTDLDAIEPFTSELTGIVETMKENLVTETRILEGTEVPVYKPFTENELSEGETKEDQWTNVSPNGYLTTDRIPTSEPGSNISSSFAELFNQDCPIQRLRRKSQPQQTVFFEGTWGGDGCETDATNECSECTVPTINEPTPGTPSEVK
jgi:hypothetical protein